MMRLVPRRMSRRVLLTDVGAAGLGLVGLAACGVSSERVLPSPSSIGTEVSVDDEPAADTAATDEPASGTPVIRGELRLEDEIDIPVREASGVATTGRDSATMISVVGDRTSALATARYTAADGFGPWESSDLADLPDWGIDDEDSQLEAIANAGGTMVAVMGEDPPVVTIGDATTGQLASRIKLVVPDDSGLQWDEAGSRGEGLVLLRGGRMLVAKEKNPSAMIVFGPAGAPAELAAADLLADGEAWDAPGGDVDYQAIATWRLAGDAGDLLEDLSGLAVDADGSLWLLSDQSRRLARIALDRPLVPGTELRELDDVLELPKLDGKPEGVAVLGNDRFLIVLDRSSEKNNGAIVALPS